MDGLERRTVVVGTGAIAALAVIAPGRSTEQTASNPNDLNSQSASGNAQSSLEGGAYWMWFGGHWENT